MPAGNDTQNEWVKGMGGLRAVISGWRLTFTERSVFCQRLGIENHGNIEHMDLDMSLMVIEMHDDRNANTRSGRSGPPGKRGLGLRHRA